MFAMMMRPNTYIVSWFVSGRRPEEDRMCAHAKKSAGILRGSNSEVKKELA